MIKKFFVLFSAASLLFFIHADAQHSRTVEADGAFAKGRASEAVEVWVSKIAAVVIGIVAVFLAYAFENQNVAFMAGLALSVAASCNFPVLAMAMFWRGTTTRGAVAGGLAGLLASVLLVVLSKTVWVAVFHFTAAAFPYENPALFSMPLAFLFTWLFSVTDRKLEPVHNHGSFFSGGVPVFHPPDLISTEKLGLAVAERLADNAAVLLRGNGQVTVGRTVAEAVMMAVYLEEAAEILHGALQIGTPIPLTTEESEVRQTEALPPVDMDRAWNYFKNTLRS